MIKIEKVSCMNLPNCCRLSNGKVEVVVTTEVGPRVLRYALLGGKNKNMFGQCSSEQKEETALGTWYIRGGHRFWHAPESRPRTYAPDNDPVDFAEVDGRGIHIVQGVEPETHMQKELTITLDATGTCVTVTHRLTNRGLWPVEVAPWGVTVMRPGGVTIIPNEPFIPHSEKLTPARSMALWHYTDLADPRWIFGQKYLRLKCDESLKYPQKCGVANRQGWAGYLHESTLFIKRFPFVDGAVYPDFGCNFETFTTGDFMEVETLGPLVKLQPDQSTIHIEHWYLFDGMNVGETEESLDAAISPLVGEIL